LKRNIKERVLKEANLLIEKKLTIRELADIIGVSKSTVHKDVSQRLITINYALALEVRKILDENKAERHLRGGLATKLKYENSNKKEKKM